MEEKFYEPEPKCQSCLEKSEEIRILKDKVKSLQSENLILRDDLKHVW